MLQASFNQIIWIIKSSWRHQMETFSALLAICAGNSPFPGEFSAHKGQWRGALMFSLICVWINDCVNNREAGDLRRYRAHYDVIVIQCCTSNMKSKNTPCVKCVELSWAIMFKLIRVYVSVQVFPCGYIMSSFNGLISSFYLYRVDTSKDV